MINQQGNYEYKPEELREGLNQVIDMFSDKKYKRGYEDGRLIGFVRGLSTGFIGGALIVGLMSFGAGYFYGNSVKPIPQQQPQSTHIQPFTQSGLPDKLNNN